MFRVKYERKVGEPTTCILTARLGVIERVFEQPNADAQLDAIEAAGKLGVWIPR